MSRPEQESQGLERKRPIRDRLKNTVSGIAEKGRGLKDYAVVFSRTALTVGLLTRHTLLHSSDRPDGGSEKRPEALSYADQARLLAEQIHANDPVMTESNLAFYPAAAVTDGDYQIGVSFYSEPSAEEDSGSISVTIALGADRPLPERELRFDPDGRLELVNHGELRDALNRRDESAELQTDSLTGEVTLEVPDDVDDAAFREYAAASSDRILTNNEALVYLGFIKEQVGDRWPEDLVLPDVTEDGDFPEAIDDTKRLFTRIAARLAAPRPESADDPLSPKFERVRTTEWIISEGHRAVLDTHTNGNGEVDEVHLKTYENVPTEFGFSYDERKKVTLRPGDTEYEESVYVHPADVFHLTEANREVAMELMQSSRRIRNREEHDPATTTQIGEVFTVLQSKVTSLREQPRLDDNIDIEEQNGHIDWDGPDDDSGPRRSL